MAFLRIPLRNFQQKATDYLDKLPVVLTSHGKPIAIVIPPEIQHPDLFEEKKVDENSKLFSKYYAQRDLVEKYKSKTIGGCKCDECGKENTRVTSIKYQYCPNGTIFEKRVCQYCLAKIFLELKTHPKSIIY